MKLSISTIELPETTLQNFAIFIGWVDGDPQTFTDYIKTRYSNPILEDIKNFNLQEAQATANMKTYEASKVMEQVQQENDQALQAAVVQAEQTANSMIETTVQ